MFSPQFGQLVQLLPDVEIKDLKVTLGLKRPYILNDILYIYNLKNSLEFKFLVFWRKWTPFIDQKYNPEKVPKNWARPSLPLIWTKFKFKILSGVP